MYILTIEDYFSSAHQLIGYKGKCENLHGHNWKVVLSVKGTKLNDIGLLIDFHELKKILRTTISYLDHTNINDSEPFDKINPSSENIAQFITKKINSILLSGYSGITVDSVTIWESNTSRCTFIFDK